MLMSGKTKPLAVHCSFADEGEDLFHLICMSFQAFINIELAKSGEAKTFK